MTETTPLDQAHAAMQADTDDTGARMRFYERLADCELFVLLQDEPQGNTVTPRLFPLEQGDVALVFDRQERLAEFSETAVPYLALSGRAVASMLAGQGIGLGVNLGVAPSSILLDADAVDWLAQTLSTKAAEIMRQPVALSAPETTLPMLAQALDTKLAMSAGLAQTAYLVHARYSDDSAADMLAIIDAIPAARPALTQAIGEAVLFCGQQTALIDVGFFAADDPLVGEFDRVGLRFDLPQRQSDHPAPKAPGMDPDDPPRLR